MNSVNKRGILSVLMALLLLLTACGSETKVPVFADVDMLTADISVTELTAHLLSETTFDDTLVEMDSDIAGSLYGANGLFTEIAAYGSTGATAEAVLVLRCDSAENASAAKDKIEKHRAEMEELYASYNARESEKLAKAFLSCDGVYVVFCVAPDAASVESVYHDYAVETILVKE